MTKKIRSRNTQRRGKSNFGSLPETHRANFEKHSTIAKSVISETNDAIERGDCVGALTSLTEAAGWVGGIGAEAKAMRGTAADDVSSRLRQLERGLVATESNYIKACIRRRHT